MIDRRFNVRHDTDPGDLQLQKALQHWHGIEPRSGFESRVWRRIRAAPAAEFTAPGLWAILRGCLAAEQAWVPAMAATAGLLIGVALALSVPQPRAAPYSAAPLLHSRTLAGAYLTMVSGGAR